MSGDNRDTGRPLVLIVDDDRQVRESLAELMVSVDLETACFGSTRDLLDAPRTIRPAAPSSASPFPQCKRHPVSDARSC
jgi:DNA-binding NtrC family response regulator